MEMNWISVEESLPELHVSLSHGFTWESERVLVCGPYYGINIVCLYSDEGKKNFWWWANRHGKEELGITHWMPLPGTPPFSLTQLALDAAVCTCKTPLIAPVSKKCAVCGLPASQRK